MKRTELLKDYMRVSDLSSAFVAEMKARARLIKLAKSKIKYHLRELQKLKFKFAYLP